MGKKTNLKNWLVITVFLLGVSSGPALSEVIYVDDDASLGGNGQSWPTAYKYLQDALYKPPSGGDEIWVAAGTYYPDDDEGANVDPNDRTETFGLIGGVDVYGGFAGGETSLNERDWQTNVTILSGDLIQNDGPDFANNGDNSYHVVKASSLVTAVLDGFTITAGNANGGGTNDYGGGMYNFSDFPTITNCTFSGNTADVKGGGMYNDSVFTMMTVTNCTFSGNSAGNYGGGMYNFLSGPTVTNCTFSGNSADWDGGGMYNESSGPIVTDCTFSGNSALDSGGGMYNSGSSSPTITNCTFSGNASISSHISNGGGGMRNLDASPIVTNCTFSGNSAEWGGGMRSGGGNPTVTNCIFWDNGPSGGIYPQDSINATYSNVQGGYIGTGNINADPLFVDANGPDNEYGTEDDNLRLLGGSPCIDAGDNTAVPGGVTTDLDGGPRFVDDPYTGDTGNPPGADAIVDMGAYEYGDIIYVDGGATGANNGSSWADAYNYLQDALADAAGRTKPVQIWVAAGMYKPGTVRADTFQLISGVAIYGGFAGGESSLDERDWQTNETILSGDIGTAGVGDNSYHVVTGSGTDATAVLDGFTIKAGYANGGGVNNNGGGMYNYLLGSPTITNCTFSNNSATTGGGMFNKNNSNPIVTNCTFTGNGTSGAGGGMYNDSSSPTATNCIFTGNSADFSGGGMQNWDSSSPTVTNCTFSGNSADNGGGMRNVNSSPMVTNCILWANTAGNGNEIYNNSSTPVISYCDIAGCGGSGAWDSSFGTDGGGNIDADPLFKDADGDDLSLSFDSPCIDAGDSNSVPADTADLDDDGDTSERTPLDLAGNARFTDDPVTVDTGSGTKPIVEIGAYERYEFCGSGAYPHLVWDLSGPDGVRDCYTDFFDFVVMAAHWLEYTGPE